MDTILSSLAVVSFIQKNMDFNQSWTIMKVYANIIKNNKERLTFEHRRQNFPTLDFGPFFNKKVKKLIFYPL